MQLLASCAAGRIANNILPSFEYASQDARRAIVPERGRIPACRDPQDDVPPHKQNTRAVAERNRGQRRNALRRNFDPQADESNRARNLNCNSPLILFAMARRLRGLGQNNVRASRHPMVNAKDEAIRRLRVFARA